MRTFLETAVGIPTSQGKKKKAASGEELIQQSQAFPKSNVCKKNVMTPTGDRTEYQRSPEGLLMVPGGCWKARQLRPITDLVL